MAPQGGRATVHQLPILNGTGRLMLAYFAAFSFLHFNVFQIKKKKKKTLLSSYRSIWPLKIRIGKQSPSSVKHERKEIHFFCLIVFVMAMKILIQISFGH